jgi:transcriptional regulator with XRE-family HTH domain
MQWAAARQNLREWLAAHQKSQSELARLAGVNRSVVNRFLEKEQPLSMASAIKLYSVVKLDLDATERRRWVEWLHLEHMLASLGESLSPSPEAPNPLEPYANIKAGFHWMNQAWAVLKDRTRIPESLSLFAKAEQAFGPYSSMAALAACGRIEQLINLSDVLQAEQEVFRVEQVYRQVMDPQTRKRFLDVRGWVAFDSCDYSAAIHIANELWKMEREHSIGIYAEHFAGLAQLAIAERLDAHSPQRQRLLIQAEGNMRLMCHYAEQKGEIADIGFQHFRLAQILREQNRSHEANAEINYARRCFVGEAANGHIDIEEANLALLNGDTVHTRTRAEAAQEGWLEQYYAGGLGRAAAVAAMSFWMEGHAQQALEPAVVAAGIAPKGACFKGDRFIDLPGQINQDVRADLDARQHAAFIATLRERVYVRSGYFACLARVVPDRSGDVLALLAGLENGAHPSSR